MDTEATTAPSPPPRRRRVLRVLAGLLLGLLALALALLVGARAWISSASGGAFVRDQVLAAVRGSIAGRLEVGRVELSGLLRIVLTDVALYAPGETSPVATVKRLEALVNVPALVSRRIGVPELLIEQPALALVEGADGWNLARAIATPATTVEPPPGAPSLPWTLDIPALQLNGGAIHATRADARYDVSGLAVTLALQGPLDELVLLGTLSAEVKEPVALPLSLSLDTTLAAKTLLTIRNLDLKAGASSVLVQGDAGLSPPRATLTQVSFELAATDANTLAGLVMLGNVKGTGTLDGSATGAHGRFDVTFPTGRAQATFDADLGLPGDDGEVLAWRGTLVAEDVALDHLLRDLPAARVNARANAQGRGVWPSGSVEGQLDATGSRFESLALEVGTVRVKSEGARLRLTGTHLAAAGADLTLTGTVTREVAALRARVRLPRLDRTRRRLLDGLPKLLGGSLPALAGNLDADVGIDGPFRHPRLTADVRAPALHYATTHLTGLDATLALERWTAPYRARASGHLDKLDSGSLRGRSLSFRANLDEKGVGVDLDGHVNEKPVRVAARGRREAISGGERWRVDSMESTAFGLTLRSTSSTQVTYARGRLDLSPPLRLDGTLGTLTLSAAGRLDDDFKARGTFDGIDLATLPVELVSLPRSTRGVISGDATLEGPVSTPTLRASLHVKDGGYVEFGPISGDFTASLVGDLATADGTLAFPGQASLELHAAASTEALTNRNLPLEAKLVARRFELAALVPLAPSLKGSRGSVSATASLTGTLASPVLTVSSSLGAIEARGYGPFDAALTADFRDDHLTLGSRVTGTDVLLATIKASTRLEAARLLDGKRPRWETLGVEGTVNVAHAVLARLPELGLPNGGMQGLAKGDFTLGDTLGKPRLDGTLVVAALASESLAPVDLTAKLDVAERVSFDATIARANQTLVTTRVRILAPTSTLLAADTGFSVLPLEVSATLAPTKLSELWRNAGRTEATLNGQVTMTGSLDAPRFSSTLDVVGVTLGQKRVGDYLFSIDHPGGVTTVRGRDRDATGQLDLNLSLKGNLGLSQLRKRVEERQARDGPEVGYGTVIREGELAGHLLMTGFDLAMLDGLDSDFRDIAGLVTARLHVDGTGLAPKVDGDLAITGGRVAPYEYGVLSDLAVVARVDWPKLTLTKLDGRGLQGNFEANGELTVADLAAPDVRGRFNLKTRGMPLVKAYQTRAWLTMTLASTFEMNGRRIEADVDISQGQLRIPELLPRRVQDLEPHPDIVFVSGGRVLGRTGRRWEARARVKIADDFNVLAPSDTNLYLGADLVISTRRTPGRTGSYLDITGPMRLPRGQLAFLGRRFILDTKSRIQFLPGAWDDPQLAIRAYFSGRDGVEVTVDVGGTPEALDTTLTSVPSMEQAEIVYYLTTGQRQLHAQSAPTSLGTALTDSALSAAGSVIAGVFKSAVEGFLPVDILSLEADAAQLGTRVRAGKYINDRLYIGGQVNPSFNPQPGANLVEVELEYRLLDDVSGRMKFGDSGRAGGEVLFQRDFWAPEQKKASK